MRSLWKRLILTLYAHGWLSVGIAQWLIDKAGARQS
jgi:hypothetical protein